MAAARRRSLADELARAGGPWWLYLGGVFTGANMAWDFARYAQRSEGWHQAGDASMALAGVLVVAMSIAIAAVKWQQRDSTP